MTGQRTAVRGSADFAVTVVPRNLPTVERHLDGEDDVATTSAAIAASRRNPMTEATTRNASTTPTAMAATLNQRIRRFLSRKA
jgi:hypothetical protein